MDSIQEFSNTIFVELRRNFIQVSKEGISNLEESNASTVYIAYDENNTPLYVGETSKTLKRRFLHDGNGAHKHKDWYSDMTYIRYISFSEHELPIEERKLLEQALSIYFKPKHYK